MDTSDTSLYVLTLMAKSSRSFLVPHLAVSPLQLSNCDNSCLFFSPALLPHYASCLIRETRVAYWADSHVGYPQNSRGGLGRLMCWLYAEPARRIGQIQQAVYPQDLRG
jgi:hypothetical protein